MSVATPWVCRIRVAHTDTGNRNGAALQSPPDTKNGDLGMVALACGGRHLMIRMVMQSRTMDMAIPNRWIARRRVTADITEFGRVLCWWH